MNTVKNFALRALGLTRRNTPTPTRPEPLTSSESPEGTSDTISRGAASTESVRSDIPTDSGDTNTLSKRSTTKVSAVKEERPVELRRSRRLAIAAEIANFKPLEFNKLPLEVQHMVVDLCEVRELKRLHLTCAWLKDHVEPQVFATIRIPLHTPFRDCGALAISKHPVLRKHVTSLEVVVFADVPRFDRLRAEDPDYYGTTNWETNIIVEQAEHRTMTRDAFVKAFDAYAKGWQDLQYPSGHCQLPRGVVNLRRPSGVVLKQILKRCPNVTSVTVMKEPATWEDMEES